MYLNKFKSWCFEKFFNIYKLIGRLITKKTETTQFSNMKNEIKNINIDNII